LAMHDTTTAALAKESSLSPSALPTCSSEKTMAATEEWMCPICREVRQDIATTTPCNHLFCLGCIQRWARLRASCPLCRIAMKTIKVSVWGDKQYIECVVSPPAVPKGREDDPGNYRLVSLTSLPGKIMEQVLLVTILRHI
uniref:RING-type E3 ubiquitin transferase n=1 Tax=Phasianus colchicus TaxID=9054 RepID=A0A669QZ26_PHACC